MRAHFSQEQVFEDIASIAPGADFMDALRDGLESCAAVIVVMGPTWATLTDTQGRRRIDLADDWVRLEVAYGLQSKGVRVFPVLVGDAHMPRSEDMPEDLQPLTRRQAIPVTVRHWAKDISSLVEQLRRVPGLAGAPNDSPPPQMLLQQDARVEPALRQMRQANYWRYSMIAVPVVLVLSVYGYFRGGDKPVAEPLSGTPEVVMSDKRSEPAATQVAPSAESVRPVAPGSKDCDVCPEMVKIPAGSFVMGANDVSEKEKPPHPVTFAQPFAAGRFEVTFDEWDACVRERGCKHSPGDDGWGRGRRPVINVSWNDARQYTQWLSAKTGKTYRLLSEAEWEYVARAGVTTPLYELEKINPNQAGRFNLLILPAGLAGIKQQTLPVGSFQPNAFGLYDLHSNAWEWTEDCWNASYHGAPAHGAAWTSGDCSRRAVRGGAWSYRRGWRSADRGGESATTRSGLIGFRVARAL